MANNIDFDQKIISIENHVIRRMIRQHFNSLALKESPLSQDSFTKKHHADRKLDWLNPSIDPSSSPLAQFFAYAPSAACDELMTALLNLGSKTILALLAKPDNTFYLIFVTAPQSVRQKLSLWVSKLSDKEVYPLFKTKHALETLTFELTDTIHFIQALNQLSSDDLFQLFQTEKKAGLVNLFAHIHSDELAILLLDLLKKLSTRLEEIFSGEANDKIIHQLARFSPKIIIKGLDVLSSLSAKVKETIFPVETAQFFFMMLAKPDTDEKSKSSIAIAYLKFLHNKEKGESSPRLRLLLQALIEHNLTKALGFYIHLNLPIQLSSEAIESIANPTVKALVQGYTLHHLLKGKSAPSSLKSFSQVIKQTPNIVHTRWHNNQTLAHLAVLHNKPEELFFLLEQGADANALDAKAHRPLDYALNQENNRIIEILLKNPGLSVHYPQKNNRHLLSHFYLKKDYGFFKDVIKKMSYESRDDAANSFAKIIKNPPKKITLDAIQKPFNKPGIFLDEIRAYCDTHEDMFTLLLIHAAELFDPDKKDMLTGHLQAFVQAYLRSLTQETCPQKDNLRLQLIILFFAMLPAKRLSFLTSLQETLSQEETTQLDLVLCQGLTRPLIYSHLSSEEHQSVYALFSKNDNKQSLKTMANLHFKQSKLSLLPSPVLQHLASALSEDELYQYSQHRLHPAMMVLALEKNQLGSRDVQRKNQLLEKLHKELSLFNSPNSMDVDELFITLDLATNAEIKSSIMDFIHNEKNDSILKNKLTQIFLNISEKKTISPTSLLHDIFLHFTHQADIVCNKTFSNAIVHRVKRASKEEVSGILNHLKKQLAPRLFIDSIYPSSSNDSNNTLAQWLSGLTSRHLRMKLTPLVSCASALSDEARGFAHQYKKSSDSSLEQAFQKLATALSKLANALIEHQFENTPLSWNDALKTALNTVQSSVQNAQKALKDQSTRIDLEKTRYLHYFLEEKIAKNFCNTLNQDYHLLKAEFDKTSLNLTESQERLSEAPQKVSQQLQKDIKQLNTSMAKAILSHPEAPALIPQLLSWQLESGYLAPINDIIKQLPMILKSMSIDEINGLKKQHDDYLALFSQLFPLLSSLQQLANESNPSLNQLLDRLWATDKDQLTQLITLSTLVGLHGFKELLQYVLTGKEQKWQANFLKAYPFSEVPLVAAWVQKNLHAFSEKASHALSVNIVLMEQNLEENQEETLQAIQTLLHEYKTIPLTAKTIIQFAKNDQSYSNDQHLSAFFSVFNDMMEQVTPATQATVFTALSNQFIHQLLEHCLSGLASDDLEKGLSCKKMLATLSQYGAYDKPERLSLIKKRLGQHDLSLFSDNNLLKKMVEDSLQKKDNLDDLTYDGVWIQRLLTNPAVIELCTPETIHLLVERYRALSLTLKQDEYDRLNKFISKKLSFEKQHQKAWERWQNEQLSNPQTKERHLEKLKRLLSFRADDSIRALFNLLEDNCHAMQEHSPGRAENALRVLYTYHNQHLQSLRSDMLFRMANYIYAKTMVDKGELAKKQNPILSWMEEHFPHENFQQRELQRKTCVTLYNESNEKVGFVDESNHAYALIQDQPVLLIQVDNWYEGTALYNKHRERIGVLTATGQIKHDNLFKHRSSALLVSLMTKEQLEESPAALDLLLRDIFTEQSIDTLYQNCTSEKKEWLEQKLGNYLSQEKKTQSAEFFESFVEHHSIEIILTTLSSAHHALNAERLFAAILKNEAKRDALFGQAESPLLHQFFHQHATDKLLTDYLLTYHQEPWFNKGLILYGYYAKKTNKYDVLTNALSVLKKRVESKLLTEDTFDTIIKRFIANKETANIVLTLFLGDKQSKSIQEARSSYTDKFVHFFNKSHILPAIKAFNKNQGTDTADYRLLLMVFAAERRQLFPPIESKLPEKLTWYDEDLQQLSLFVTRHLDADSIHDKHGELGEQLLSEIVFRCAHAGFTSLFYQENGQLNKRVTKAQLKRSILDALAARFYLVHYTKEKIEEFYTMIMSWFCNMPDSSLDEILKDNDSLIDWKALEKASWAHTYETHLPLLAAFLINYSGPSAAISELLEDMLKDATLRSQGTIILHLSQIMVYYPHRDVSHVIFNALEKAVVDFPEMLTNNVFKNLTTFYAKHHLANAKSTPLEEGIELLKHFGLQKHYAVSKRVAEFLYKPTSWGQWFLKCFFAVPVPEEDTHNSLSLAITEASVEATLHQARNKWHFAFSKWLYRLWHYGSQKPTGLIRFCDSTASYLNPIPEVETIKTPLKHIQQNRTPQDNSPIEHRYDAFLKQKSTEEKTLKCSVKSSLLGNAINLTLFGGEHPVAANTMAEILPEMSLG